MRPSSIVASDGSSQSFKYDDHGRIVTWVLTSNGTENDTSYIAHYSYPDENTIIVKSKEFWNIDDRYFEETIQLVDGLAKQSVGSLSTTQMRKSYRIEFSYDAMNQLNIVRHSEVFGLVEDIKDAAWNSAWTWENFLIWQDGNLIEFRDYQGNTTLFQSTKFEYTPYVAKYPLIVPLVINSAHHYPLLMQGVFGLNSANLVNYSTVFDGAGNSNSTRQYTYELEDGLISKYTQTDFGSNGSTHTIDYNVIWAQR